MITRATPEQILRARAEALARPSVIAKAPASDLQFVLFRLGIQRFALALPFTREVQPRRRMTPVPCTPAWVRGLINVRGEILTVLDLARFFGVVRETDSDKERVILVDAGEMTVGVVVDEVLGTRGLASHDLAPPLPTSGGLRVEYVQGITSDGITVLAAEPLFSDQRWLVRDDTQS